MSDDSTLRSFKFLSLVVLLRYPLSMLLKLLFLLLSSLLQKMLFLLNGLLVLLSVSPISGFPDRKLFLDIELGSWVYSISEDSFPCVCALSPLMAGGYFYI